MEQELAIKLQDNGITYLYLTIDVFATRWSGWKLLGRLGTLSLALTWRCLVWPRLCLGSAVAVVLCLMLFVPVGPG